MDTENTKKAEEVQPSTADDFRKKFQFGEVVTSPTETIYRIRPIAPHFYLTSYTTQILDYLPDDVKERIAKGDKPTDEEMEKYVPQEERLNVGSAIRPVLLEGVLAPKIIDVKKEGRDLVDGELDVDELLAVMDEAMFLFNAIHKLSGGTAQKGESFPDRK